MSRSSSPPSARPEGQDAPHPAGKSQPDLAPQASRRLRHIALVLTACIGATYGVEPLHELQPWKRDEAYVPFWNIVGREWLGEGERLAQEREELERLREASRAQPARIAPRRPLPARTELGRFPAYLPGPDEAEISDEPIENAAALEHFHRRLALIEVGASDVIARASHWGDSLLGDDGLTYAIRRRLQARFGDAGHGFHALGPFNEFYYHRGIRFQVVHPWASRCEILYACEEDARYGLGGVSTRSSTGARSWFATAKEWPGDRISHFELWYQTAPRGGVFRVTVDKETVHDIPTEAPEPSDEVALISLADGPHEITVDALGPGSVRGYGVVFERQGPGVVWENLAVIGTSTHSLSRQNAEHIQAQIRRRQSDLLVFSLGGNDVGTDSQSIIKAYRDVYAKSLRHYRAARPEASCLVISVTAHGQHSTTGGVEGRPSVPHMVAIQRDVARQEGCAFFDLYRAMGGERAVLQWYAARPQLLSSDLAHPTSEGHEVLASLIHRALMHSYAEFRRHKAGQPFEEWRQRVQHQTREAVAAPETDDR